MRLEVVNNRDRRAVALVFPGSPVLAAEVLSAACNKFRLQPKRCRLFRMGRELQLAADTLSQGASVWVVHGEEPYSGPSDSQAQAAACCSECVSVLDGADVWIDPEAVKQVHMTVLNAGGMIMRAVGMPDLHQGPTGVAILARAPMVKIPGYDIG